MNLLNQPNTDRLIKTINALPKNGANRRVFPVILKIEIVETILASDYPMAAFSATLGILYETLSAWVRHFKAGKLTVENTISVSRTLSVKPKSNLLNIDARIAELTEELDLLTKLKALSNY